MRNEALPRESTLTARIFLDAIHAIDNEGAARPSSVFRPLVTNRAIEGEPKPVRTHPLASANESASAAECADHTTEQAVHAIEEGKQLEPVCGIEPGESQ